MFVMTTLNVLLIVFLSAAHPLSPCDLRMHMSEILVRVCCLGVYAGVGGVHVVHLSCSVALMRALFVVSVARLRSLSTRRAKSINYSI